MEGQVNQLAEILENSEKIVFFGGIGVSEGSGISDFRKEKGMYSEKLESFLNPEQIVSYSFFRNSMDEFYEFYKSKLISLDAKPNDCHIALNELEKMGKIQAIVTLNIDGLHQTAGSKKVHELNGSIHRNYCSTCGAPYSAKYVLDADGIPTCTRCEGTIKPDVILFGERFDNEMIEYIIYCIMKADTIIVGGTSLAFCPIAGIIKSYFEGKNLVVINETITPADNKANLIIQGNVVDVMKQAVESMK